MGGLGGNMYDSMPSENMRPLKWVTIDPQRVHTLWSIHTGLPLAVRCRNYVLDHLFSSELELLNSEGEQLSFDANFANFFQRRYKEFSFNAYDMYMVLGIVPVVLIQDDNKHYYPCVPKYGTFILQCAYAVDRERMYFRVLRPKALKVYKDPSDGGGNGENGVGKRGVATMQDSIIMRNGGAYGTSQSPASYNIKGTGTTDGPVTYGETGFSGAGMAGWVPDESVHIITGLGSDPGINGEIRSPLASIVDELFLMASLEKYMLIAEYRMTNPAVTVQYHKTEDPDDLSKYRGVAAGAWYDSENPFSPDRQIVEATDMQLRATKEHLYYRALEDAHNYGISEQRLTSMDTARVHAGEGTVCVPKGLEYVKNDSNVTQAGNKYLPQKAMTDDHVSGLYGIPLPLLRNSGALRGNIAGQNEIFRNTLIKNAKLLGDMATAAYMAIYGKDGGRYCDAMFGRKAAVDDTQFVSHGLHEAQRRGVEIIPDESGSIAPPPPMSEVVVGESKKLLKDAGTDEKGAVAGDDAADVAAAITQILAENADAAQRAAAGGRKRKRDERDAPASKEAVKKLRVTEIGTVGFVVKINVSHLMNDKAIEHMFNIGSIKLYQYQNMMLNRNGFSTSQFKKAPTTAEEILADLLRDPAAEAPREDSYQPEGVGLRDPAQKKRRVVPTGILLELARHGGDVDKWEADKKQKENEATQKAKQAISKKKKRDAGDKKADKKAAKKDKKSKPKK